MKEISKILEEDFEQIYSTKSIDWQILTNKRILITGATGLIGSNLVNALLYANEVYKANINIVTLVRDIEKAKKRFISDKNLEILTGSIEKPIGYAQNVDYIVHAANPTSSKYFITNPVETIKSSITGTTNLLDFAREKNVKGFVFLSSMEVYGNPERGEVVTEEKVAGFDPYNVRNCYPMSKKLCESLCRSYFSEYSVPTKVIRLTQTFGPGIEYGDGRIFAEFMRGVIENRDIILKTKGETERCYLYTADAVTSILTVLLNGKPGEFYTAANPETYCSIAQMAELIAKEIAQNKIKMQYVLEDITKLGYANTLYMNLDTTKLQQLGWTPKTKLKQMFERMIATISN